MKKSFFVLLLLPYLLCCRQAEKVSEQKFVALLSSNYLINEDIAKLRKEIKKIKIFTYATIEQEYNALMLRERGLEGEIEKIKVNRVSFGEVLQILKNSLSANLDLLASEKEYLRWLSDYRYYSGKATEKQRLIKKNSFLARRYASSIKAAQAKATEAKQKMEIVKIKCNQNSQKATQLLKELNIQIRMKNLLSYTNSEEIFQ
ncbi:MAG: hypothetical protein AB1349_13175 [Elusimicrobiota bacterium]